ncbi:MAG: Holliday junction resolvase RuvX [Candidatus Ryanbacteria bacterium]|nr:Holliday junction resolvase RuvX [Candidatus Ryanbacteria bacterium]
MARVLGIDYGTRRIGIALSNEDGSFAFPYAILSKDKNVLDKIRSLCQKEKISLIVLGLPRALDGGETEMTHKVLQFRNELGGLGVPMALENEFFSSKEARRAPLKKKHVDASAAAIVLQSYLDRKKAMLE